MDELAANIVATCPSSFGGSAGGMFAQTITALVAAHCAFTADNEWPPDNAEELIKQDADGDGLSFDFIIVGAGTAGSLLTNRLSEAFPAKKILLVEAGDDPDVASEVPLLIFQNKENSCHYETETQESSCRGFVDHRCLWPVGKGMGGSSSVNAMLYVRGHPLDYDTWEANGNPGWGYKDVKPYFEKVEKYLNLTDAPVLNEDSKPFHNMMAATWTDSGYKKHTHIGAKIGTTVTRTMISDGRRKNSAKYFLRNLPNKNVKVMKNTKASRVLFSKNKQVEGIEAIHSSGYKMIIQAKSDVILSAGAIDTPKLLMLSGIGPTKHLSTLGIPQILNLPVGQNLQDHVIVPLYLKVDKEHTTELEQVLSIFIKYILTRKGPLSHIGFMDFFSFINTKDDSDRPDVQYHHTYYVKRLYILKPYLQAIALKKELVEAILELNKNNDLIVIVPTLLHPQSRGEILLRDNDPNTPPTIKTNILTESNDIDTLVKAIRTAQKLLETDILKGLGVQMGKLNMTYCSEHTFDTDIYWGCYVKTLSQSIHHYVGTAKMGNDGTSVVDSQFKVHGVSHLRVVDASVMPIVPSANTMATTLMLAEKAADIIIREYGTTTKNEL